MTFRCTFPTWTFSDVPSSKTLLTFPKRCRMFPNKENLPFFQHHFNASVRVLAVLTQTLYPRVTDLSERSRFNAVSSFISENSLQMFQLKCMHASPAPMTSLSLWDTQSGLLFLLHHSRLLTTAHLYLLKNGTSYVLCLYLHLI